MRSTLCLRQNWHRHNRRIPVEISRSDLDHSNGSVLHGWAAHVAGQNNPAGIDLRAGKDTVPFTPYATVKDIFGTACFAKFVFYIPNYLGHSDNCIPANPSVTPAEIVPEGITYLSTPSYSRSRTSCWA